MHSEMCRDGLRWAGGLQKATVGFMPLCLLVREIKAGADWWRSLKGFEGKHLLHPGHRLDICVQSWVMDACLCSFIPGTMSLFSTHCGS